MLDAPRRQCGDLAGLTAEQIRALLPDEFFAKRGYAPCRPDDRRRFARSYFRVEAELHLQTTLPAFERDAETTTVYLSDLSRSGLGFICDRELYPSETLEINFSDLGPRNVVVKRCRRLPKGCFEVGCAFLAV